MFWNVQPGNWCRGRCVSTTIIFQNWQSQNLGEKSRIWCFCNSSKLGLGRFFQILWLLCVAAAVKTLNSFPKQSYCFPPHYFWSSVQSFRWKVCSGDWWVEVQWKRGENISLKTAAQPQISKIHCLHFDRRHPNPSNICLSAYVKKYNIGLKGPIGNSKQKKPFAGARPKSRNPLFVRGDGGKREACWWPRRDSDSHR